MSPFLSAYFSRLGWTGTPGVSLNTLRELHIHHNGAIPFEIWMCCCQERYISTIAPWKIS